MSSKTVTDGMGAALAPVVAVSLGDAGGEAPDLGCVPLEWLETELTSMAASIAAATAQWLAWLAVYARREGYLTWGCRSAAQPGGRWPTLIHIWLM